MPTQCDEIAVLLPQVVDSSEPVALPVQRHVESCLRCQAELARYRRMLRGLQLLRTQYFEPTPGMLAATLASITAASERRAVNSVLTKRAPRLRRRGRPGAVAAAGDAPPPAAASRALARAPQRRTPIRRGLARSLAGLRCYPVAPRPLVPDAEADRPEARPPEGSSSTGRAPVSKTGGWGFESLLPCSLQCSHASPSADEEATR